MIIAGILGIIGGLASTLYGIMENSNMERQLENLFENGTTNPGTPFIAVGIAVMVIGVILLTVGLIKKVKKAQ